MKYLPLPSCEEIAKVLHYDPVTGLFTLVNPKRSRTKTPREYAGVLEKNGYLYLYVQGRRYLAHRLAWKITYGVDPDMQIDHRDTVRTNNAISNLRCAAWEEQARNHSISKNNSSGFKGIQQKKNTWYAHIYINGKQTYLGSFKSPEEAHKKYVETAKKYFGEFANAG